MDFFNDLGKRFSNVAKSVSDKTRDSVESTRLANDLRAQRHALERMYAELGRLYCDIRMGKADEADAERLFEGIQAAKARIEALSGQREARRCPACGTVMPKEARFCFACGKRLPEDAPKLDAEGPADAEYCPKCGAQRAPGEKTCDVCGKPFEPAARKEAKPPEPVAMNVEEPESFEDA